MADSDEQQVHDAVLDYFEGWFDADARRMDRALHPELVKRWAGDSQTAFGPVLTKQRMLELAAAGEGREDRGRTDVEVVDIHQNMAYALAVGGPYREYLHLLRTADGWRIVGALWQYASEHR
jgi:Putative lumazine-binding